MLGVYAYSMPAQNLSREHQLDFYGGNGFFTGNWVEAGASAESRDGLGPLFNARSCAGCHFEDGKGAPPEGEGPFVGLLLRLSVDGAPDPVYGGQLQDQALPDVPVEATPEVTWIEAPGAYPDGAAYSLRRPVFTLHDPGYGALPEDLEISPRLAPHMIGLGLLEAIPEEALAALEDPDDLDGDGISGNRQRVMTAEGERTGRFGWKAEAPDVAAQSAGAFAGDMGLTSALKPADDCTAGQPECLEQPDGGRPELESEVFESVVLYARALAVPMRRDPESPEVLAGRDLFHELGCAACHVPSFTTGDAALAELSEQRIWPYTDLLLHDMGEGLADERPVGLADGREWKTPPLWGLGLADEVARGELGFLHDGRARSLEEAVLWHGGEAEGSRDAFLHLSAEERDAVLAFVEDL
ncbi:MAG: thiol oxidoreductase [Alphaproteobacteria bacterium]|nr:thiol oxidoreductase [Alphaproteobacteria bacterium]